MRLIYNSEDFFLGCEAADKKLSLWSSQCFTFRCVQVKHQTVSESGLSADGFMSKSFSFPSCFSLFQLEMKLTDPFRVLKHPLMLVSVKGFKPSRVAYVHSSFR